MESNVGIALAKELCPVCLKEQDGPILMNQKLTEKEKNKVENINGKVIGFKEKPCEDCQKHDAFLIVGFDQSKSDIKNLPQGFYRTGQVVGIKKDCELAKSIKKNIPLAKRGFCFVPQEVMKNWGLIKKLHKDDNS